MVGETVERYRVEAFLGEGGAAAVYRVVHGSLGSTHALKVLRISTDRARERLLREGRTQSRVHHPNLVAVTDILAADDRPALVLEYVDGPSLDRWLQQHDRPSLIEALSLFHGIVRGVEAAHAAGLVHRDLKPQNVLLALTADGLVPKIADFGLVRDLTGHEPDVVGALGGTAGYMAPEVLQSADDIDERADLFGLGCILYELVTGRQAFPGNDLVSAAHRTLQGEYTPPEHLAPDLPPSVGQVIRRLLEVDRDRRIGSCAELLEHLYGERGPAGQETLSFDAIPVVQARVPTTPARPAVRVGFSGLGAVVTLLVGLLATTGAGLGGLALGARGLGPGPAGALTPVVATTASIDPRPVVQRAHERAHERSYDRAAVRAPVRAPDKAFAAAPVPVRVPTPPQALEPPEPPPQAPVAAPIEDPPASARLVVEGDGTVELTGPDGAVAAPGPVRPGSWRWRARFGPAGGPAGTLQVDPGQTVVLRCSSFAMRCLTLTR